MPEEKVEGSPVLAHLSEAAAQVITHGLNSLNPGARQRVAAALADGLGDIELSMAMRPFRVLVEFVAADGLQRVTLFRVVSPDAANDNTDRGDDS